MTPPNDITPAEAAALAANGAVIIDIREADEREAGFIPGSSHAPLSGLAAADLSAAPGQAVIFHCKGGGRTRMNALALHAKADGRACYLMQGGLDGWAAAGLPVERPG